MEQAGLARALWVLVQRLAAGGRGFAGEWVPCSTLFQEAPAGLDRVSNSSGLPCDRSECAAPASAGRLVASGSGGGSGSGGASRGASAAAALAATTAAAIAASLLGGTVARCEVSELGHGGSQAAGVPRIPSLRRSLACGPALQCRCPLAHPNRRQPKAAAWTQLNSGQQ